MGVFQFGTNLRYNQHTKQWIAYHIKETFVWNPDQPTLAHRLSGTVHGISEDGQYMLFTANHLLEAASCEKVPITQERMARFSLGQRTIVRITNYGVMAHEVTAKTKILKFPEEVKPLPGTGVRQGIDSAVISPNGRFLAVAFSAEGGGFENMWGAVYTLDKEKLYRVSINRFANPLFHFSADSKLLAVNPRDRTIHILNSATGQVVTTIAQYDTPRIALLPQADDLLFAYRDGRNEWKLANTEGVLATHKEEDRIAALAFAEDTHLGVLLNNGRINVYQLTDMRRTQTYRWADE